MLQYPTPSDLRYGDVANTTMPQGGTQWGPGRPDSSQSAVNCDTDDRQRAQHSRTTQSLPSDYTPATTYTATSRDSYPAQAQSHCSGQYPYPSQPYASTVNYVLPPYDFAEYPVSRHFVPFITKTEYSPRRHQIHAGNIHHGGHYSPHGSAATHYEYPPSDPISFHSPAYDPTCYFSTDGPLCSPLEGQQHQHSLVPVPTTYSQYDVCLAHYEHYAQPPVPPVLPSSSSSELGHALVETPPPESQHINHGSIALPSLAMPSPSAPKHNPSETLVGLNPVKTEYASGVNGQPFSPMASLSTLTSEFSPHPKEECQEQVHVFPTSVPHGHLHHRQHTRDSLRLVQDPAAYPVFTPPPASKVCSPPHIRLMSFILTSRGSDILLHRPSRYQRLLTLRARVFRRRFPRRSRRRITGHQHRAYTWSIRALRARRRRQRRGR